MRMRNAECRVRTSSAALGADIAHSAFRTPDSAFGFTLIEILIVLAILGITAAAVVPAFARAPREDSVSRTARDLERVLAGARETALTRAVRVRLTIVPETARYWVLLESGPGATVLDSGQFALAAGVQVHSPVQRPSVVFDPLGIADSDPISVTGPTRTMALVIDRWTGEGNAEAR